MVEIRPAVVTDAVALSQLWTRAGLHHRVPDVARELASVLSREPDLVLVAWDGSSIVGSLFGTYDGRRGWVNRLATHPDARGRGIAGALLAALERALVARGCRKLNLLIEPSNAGVVTFYQRHGFAEKELVFMEKYLPDPTSG